MEERKEPSAEEGKKASPGRPVWLSSRSILPRLLSPDIMDIGFYPDGAGMVYFFLSWATVTCDPFVGVIRFTFPLPLAFW